MSGQRSKLDASFFLDPGLEQRLHQPVAEGSALSNAAYTNPEFYTLEQRTVFRNTWVFTAFAHQLESPGDMLPVEVALQPVVIVKTSDGSIKAFHNVCRHRGAKLVHEPKQRRKNFTCPNHSWSYSLDGQLLARPHFYGGEQHDVNHDACHRANLNEIKCAVWHDWVFVNLSGDAGELTDYVSIIEEKLRDYDFSALRFGQALEFTIQANWKLAIENFIEPYHVFSCHPWLNSFVSMAERTAPEFKEHVLMCGYEFKKTDPARGEGLPYFPNLPADKQKSGDWFVLFPNFAFEVFPDQVDVFIATPKAPDQCTETIALYFIGDGAAGYRYKEARERVVQNWHDLNKEDIGIIERMQAGRMSEGFDGGVLSPYWDPVLQHFGRLIFNAVRAS